MGQQLRILLVEDDDLLMISFADMLRDLNHNVLEATCASEALAHLEANIDAIDVLITDINLPEMDGCELVKRARALIADLPVVYSSGHRQDRVKDLADDPLMRFLEKPFGSDDCEQVLQSFRIGLVNAA